MAQYIDKSDLVTEIEKRVNFNKALNAYSRADECNAILSLIDTLEVKEVGIAIPDIDDLLEEDDINPNSKEAKIFKESYYMALERLKERNIMV